jgi:hypothetical protein
MSDDRIKSIADKYISADGSTPTNPVEMSDVEYRRLEDRYLTERARRWYAKRYPKEAAFRAFCARVKREFMDKLTPAQEEAVEYVCDAPPLPTLDQFLTKQQAKRERGWEFNTDVGLAQLSFDHACYNYKWKKQTDFGRIWRRVRADWGLIELDSFEHELEKASEPAKPDQDLPAAKEMILAKLGITPKPAVPSKRRI